MNDDSFIQPYLDQTYYDATLQTWLVAILVATSAALILILLSRLVGNRLLKVAERSHTERDSVVVTLFSKIRSYFWVVLSLYVTTRFVALPPVVESVISSLTVITMLVQVGIWGSAFMTLWLERYRKERLEEDAASVTTMAGLGFIGKMLLWTVVLLLALDNLGVEVTALIAGLGVGGIAVALAVQNVLGDLFASLSIVLDKPFVIGDFLIVDTFLGSVEYIGLKTTRIRSLSGEQVVFSNSDLLNSRIRNFKRMFERRVVFSIGVTYQTPYEKLVEIPVMIREIIEKQDDVRFDRAHFKEYGNFALVFEMVYFVLSPEFNTYMDIQQRINLSIYQRFQEEEIEFAYPTQTLFIENDFAAPALAQRGRGDGPGEFGEPINRSLEPPAGSTQQR